MTYWRMQLHPGEREEALKHCVESLAAGYIGLDFATEVGDLMATTQANLPATKRITGHLRMGGSEREATHDRSRERVGPRMGPETEAV